MNKQNLPVIVLKGIVLLPNNDIRLEFDNNDSNNVIDLAELFHDNEILVVSQDNPLEEVPNVKELSLSGVIAKISHKIELPNNKIRVIISGKQRAKVFEYLNLNNSLDVLESILTPVKKIDIDPKEEKAIIRKLYREVEEYIRVVPYISNSALSLIKEIEDLSKMTDILAPHLPITQERMQEYLEQNDPIKRASMILEDVEYETEMLALEKKLDFKVKQDIDNSQKEYILKEKIKAIKEELGEVAYKETEIDILKNKVEKLNAPIHIKERLDIEIKKYENLSSMSPETTIIRNYIDWLLALPYNNQTTDNSNLKEVENKLNNSHDGLEEVKKRIIEYLAVKQNTNSLKGPIICLVGPPGVGKTSLAYSIAEAINRTFIKISVGGINDEAEIMGHRRTYLGASPGRIIQSLKKAKSSNPVFLIDEIDKMTKDLKGDPASALLEILDPEQNKYFSDNYIEEEIDLSNIMFITTANYIEQIPEPLKDRLEVIELSGYTEYEKLSIAKNYLIKKVCQNNGIDESSIIFSDEVLKIIIGHYTKEAGVRELERQLDKIIRKIVTSIVINKIHVKRLNITKENLSNYLGKQKYQFISESKNKIGVVNGLAYTQYGGDTLPIEVNFYKGDGKLVLTGSLGDVIKESAHIALSYIKANADYFNIDYNILLNNDIHIHLLEGAIPKDGPSAGIALTTALISTLTNKEIDKNIAMTGEITLRGEVLAIGGLKEKSIGAHRKGIKTIIIPKNNENDLDLLPNEIKESINYILVNDYKEVYSYIIK